MASKFSLGNNLAVKFCEAVGLNPSNYYEFRFEYERLPDGSESFKVITDPPNHLDEDEALESLRTLLLEANK